MMNEQNKLISQSIMAPNAFEEKRTEYKKLIIIIYQDKKN